MPVQTLRIRIAAVSVLDDSDWLWGAGEWHLHATVDGQRVGNPATEFSVHAGDFLALPPEQWGRVVDVTGHTAGSKIEIKFHVIEEDTFSDDHLGEVKATLHYPYDDPFKVIYLESPMLDGGWFHDDYRCYSILVIAAHNDEVASTNTTGPTRIPISRTSQGNATFNSVRGEPFTPRVDIHPVVPVPQAPSHIPRPVAIPAGMAPAQVPPAAQVTVAPKAPALNALPNPPLIPILATTDPDFNNRVAKLAITAYAPGNLDTTKFFWVVKSGPAVISGPNTGLEVQVRGQGSATAPDQMAVLEVHWENADGPVLAVYRAWVGRLGTLKYRVNRINGKAPATGGTAPYPVNVLMPDARIQSVMEVVQAIVYQAGIVLIPDDNTTAWEGAIHAGNAIFDVTATNNQHTNNVSHEVIAAATRYNFRPGTINIAIVFSTAAGNAAAVDRNGIEGEADSAKRMGDGNQYTWTGSGVEKKLSGSPSTSWIKPAGIGRDGAGVEQKMLTIQPSDRVRQAKKFDKDFVTARKAADASFSAQKMGELYACQVPARWGLGPSTITPAATPSPAMIDYEWQCGVNFAHELCHVLGLAHRGSGGNSTGPSADAMDFTDASGAKRGHPWNENIMTYGYGNISPPLAHDIDLIQAMVVRRHPAIRY